MKHYTVDYYKKYSSFRDSWIACFQDFSAENDEEAIYKARMIVSTNEGVLMYVNEDTPLWSSGRLILNESNNSPLLSIPESENERKLRDACIHSS